MNNPIRTRLRSQFGNRAAVAFTGVACFTIGAGGWVAAERGSDTTNESEPSTTSQTQHKTLDSVVSSSVVSSSVVSSTTPDTTTASPSSSVPSTVADTVVDTVATTVAGTIADSSTSSSSPTNTINDDNDSSTSSSVPSSTIQDSTSSSVPGDTASSSSVPTTPLPGPFTRKYESAGGSITVTWNGTALSLDAVSPAPGFQAEIDDQAWDRVRVEFENDDSDWRIEIRFNDGAIREEIKN
jgi:hypothetical protein